MYHWIALIGIVIASEANAEKIPPDLMIGKQGSLSGSDYHESGINLPADAEDICLDSNTNYELSASAYNQNLIVYIQGNDCRIGRAGAWSLAHSHELTNLSNGKTYFSETLRFRTPVAVGRCVPMYAVVSVDFASSSFYGSYTVRLHRLR